jgi:hypothetical protein
MKSRKKYCRYKKSRPDIEVKNAMMPFTTAMTFIPSKGHLANWRVTEGKCKIIYHDSEDSLVSLFLHIITYVLKYTQYMYIIDKEFLNPPKVKS